MPRCYATEVSSRVLITGGAGFIGSHLSERLLAEGHDVICVDNFFTGSRRNIEHLFGNPRFEVLRHDVTFPLYVEVDQIYNLACPASPVHYQHDPVQTTKTSVHGAINMLGLAKRTGARILQASTSEVYGDPEVHPQEESYWGRVNPVGIRSCYDEGKRCAETLFFDYWRQHQLEIKVARIFNTYGPRMRTELVIPIFLKKAFNNEPITIAGDGSQYRNFIYVEDLADVHIKALNDKAENQILNVEGMRRISIKNIADTIRELMDDEVLIEYIPERPGDYEGKEASNEKIKRLLGWEPKIDFEDGMKETIDWFKQNGF